MSAHPLSTTVALAVANHLWQSTVVLGIVALLALTLRQTSARIRYLLWLTASLKFLIPFSLLIALGGHLASLRPASPQRAAQANVAPFLAMEYINQPFTIDTLPAQTTPTAAPEISLTARAAALWNRSPILPATLASLWLIGFLTVLTRWAHRWLKISSAIRRTHPLLDGHELETLRKIERLAGLPQTIEMRSLPASMEPGIFGLIRPVLLWPHAITARLDDAHLEAVLAHEVCHVQRRDNLTAGLHMVVEAIFWFHPLVWWLETRLIEEREHACDETVLQLCGQRTIYAESILKVCEFCIESPLACVSGVTGADLKKRIVQIMTERTIRKLTLGKKLLLTATALLVVAVPIVLGQTKSAQRMMAAAMNATPTPFRAAIHAMMPVENTPSTGLIAEVQTPSGTDATLPQEQAEGKPFKFDVVSIRPTKPGNQGGPAGLQFTGDGLQASNLSLSMMLTGAYQQQLEAVGQRILGLPDWARTETFDVKAKVADSEIAEWSRLSQDIRGPAQKRKALSLLLLLTEQFKLKTHSETRDEQVYALVVAKGGPKLKPSASDDPPTFQMKSPGHLSYSGTPIETVVRMCAQLLGRKVVDKTGLTGRYDFTLDWTQYQDAPATAPGSEPNSSELPVFTVVQEQLGLKLESQKGSVEYIVVDHVEKPEAMDGAEVPQTDLRPDPFKRRIQDSAVLAPMAKDANPSFEVATIKPSKPGNTNQGFHLRGHRVFIENEPIISMISVAYGIHKTQITGAPAWFETDPYDIDGVPDTPGEPTLHQQQLMIQKILADRFNIKFHHEKRELSVYAITVAKGGPKLTPNTTAREGQPDEQGNGHGSWRSMKFTNNTMADLALELQFEVGKPVIDQTGLTGRYDFTLKFTTDDAHLDDPNAPPGFFTAIQEQLGLKLEPKKDQADVLVIDHAERPSEN